jgi:glycerophosphoryl diester phosphodiesterase
MATPLPQDFLHLPIAHRGLHDRAAGRVENSPAAIKAAIDAGYAIEIDLQLAADGTPMVFHDETLDRLTPESGPLNARTSAELTRIPLLGGKDMIPTLAEVLVLVAGRAPLLIELKDQTRTLSNSDGKLEAATAAALADYVGPVAVMSFNPSMMTLMARLASRVPRGLITSSYDPVAWHPVPEGTCTRLREIPDYDHVGASFISHQADDLARPRVSELKTMGATVLCWTISSPDQEAVARQIADNVTFERYRSPLPA